MTAGLRPGEWSPIARRRARLHAARHAHDGLPRLALFAMQRFVHSAFVLNVTSVADLVSRGPAAEEAHLLERTEVHDFREFRRTLEHSAIEARLEAGHDCMCVWAEGAIVAAIWLRYDYMWLPEMRRAIDLPAGTAYAYDSYTSPAHRHRGFAASRAPHTGRHLRNAGYDAVASYVRVDNHIGLAAARAAGAVTTGSIRWLHLGPAGVAITTTREHRKISPQVRGRALELPRLSSRRPRPEIAGPANRKGRQG